MVMMAVIIIRGGLREWFRWSNIKALKVVINLNTNDIIVDEIQSIFKSDSDGIIVIYILIIL